MRRVDGQDIYETIDLKPRRCEKSDFGVVSDYFLALPYLDKLKCVDNYEKTFVYMLIFYFYFTILVQKNYIIINF